MAHHDQDLKKHHNLWIWLLSILVVVVILFAVFGAEAHHNQESFQPVHHHAEQNIQLSSGESVVITERSDRLIYCIVAARHSGNDVYRFMNAIASDMRLNNPSTDANLMTSPMALRQIYLDGFIAGAADNAGKPLHIYAKQAYTDAGCHLLETEYQKS